MSRPWALLLMVLASGPIVRSANAQGGATAGSPYIDQLREEMKQKGDPTEAIPRDAANPEPYIQTIKSKLPPKDSADIEEGSYSERLRREIEAKDDASAPKGSYTESEKARLGPSDGAGGAIAAVNEGRSELKAKKVGEIHHAAGLRIGALPTREVSASAEIGGASFDSVYGSGYKPEVTLFYEYQPWHSEWYGSLGLMASLGVGVYNGSGRFAFDLTRAGTSETFGPTSRVKVQLFSVPATVGLSYRLNLLRLFRPFVMAGPTVVGFYEQRNDGGDSHTAHSEGVFLAGGVSILLDWLSGGASWELYAGHGIKHYYLTVEYDRISTFSGPVDFTVSGIFAGLAFEF